MRIGKNILSAVAYAGYLAAANPRLRKIVFNSIRLNRPETDRLRRMEELRFLAYLFHRRHESRSQILQDLWVCYELGERQGGFFVEFGATNGLVNSNTWLLEKKYDWKGILVEPNPIWHSALVENRSSIVDRRCVSSSTGKTVAFLTTDDADPELSSIAEFAKDDHFASVRADGVEIKVDTISLNDLLKEYNAPFEINYISIDTEGSEFDILSNFDFSKHAFDVISVEQNRFTERKIESLLSKNGYIRVFKEFSQWDGWYVHAEQRIRRATQARIQHHQPVIEPIAEVN